MNVLLGLIRSLRPHQWIKNSFVLAPLVFSLNIDEPSLLLRALLATFAFCLVSGAVYLLNDILDVEADRKHPEKCKRPIAAGLLSVRFARAACLGLLLAALLLSAWLSLWVALVSAVYFATNIAYSLKLKHVAYLDVSIISLGFILRLLAGSLAIDVPLSVYLVLCTFLLSLYLAFGKRLHELVSTKSGERRRVLDQYRVGHLRVATVFVAVSTILSYTAYTLAPQTQTFFDFDSPRLLWTVPFAALGVGRFYMLTTAAQSAASPTDRMLRDPLFLGNFLAWTLITTIVVYAL